MAIKIINTSIILLFWIVITVATEFNEVEEYRKVGKVSQDYGIKLMRSLVENKDENPSFDTLNMLLSTSALLAGCSLSDRKVLFKANHFETAYNEADEALDAVLKLNFHGLHTSKTIFVVSAKFDVTYPFFSFLAKYPYAYLKIGVDLENDTKEETAELLAEIANITADKAILEKFGNSLKLGKAEKLIMLHGNHFERKFKLAFNKSKTVNGTFLNFGTQETTVPFMKMKSEFRHYADDYFSALEIPFDNGDKLIIFLPNKNDGYKYIMNNMTQATIHMTLQKMKMKSIHISIPKFKIISEKRMDSFEKDSDHKWITSSKASFEGISGGPGLYFSNVVIVTSFELNENGLRYTSISTSGSERSNEAEFDANHPFIYFVLTNFSIALNCGVINKL
ncbi:leukocyte elastase inhibitor-like protein [Leptotrombidium deliense]|uniref:Leukocyte elastase inhibitor-like protein n=1 Tax=Leptotrombidium deliense TaxID=299467 RepID=A0A443RZL7_9ACAR|nr:leukocyte elastase inhibitor-like protein [Leptotrombidium deliense]